MQAEVALVTHTPPEAQVPLVALFEQPCAYSVYVAGTGVVEPLGTQVVPSPGTGKPITDAGEARVVHEGITSTIEYDAEPPMHEVEPPYARTAMLGGQLPPMGPVHEQLVHFTGASKPLTPPASVASGVGHPLGHASVLLVPVASPMGPFQVAGTAGAHAPAQAAPLDVPVLDELNEVPPPPPAAAPLLLVAACPPLAAG
jgi:hypothetical protein